MNKIIYNLVYNRKKCLNKKGMALVQVEAYLGRKKKYFSTKVYLKPEQWDNKKLIVKNHPNADALNRLIYEFVATIEKKELELWQQGKRISLELLKNALTTQENNSSFISFFRQEVMNSSLKDSTKRNHLSTLMLLQEFKKNITFSDLTFELISSFEYFLQLKGYHTNTIAKHMKHLKRHVNIAKKKRTMLRCPPFRILKSKITRQQEILYGENLQFYKYHHLAHLQRKQYYLPAYHLE